MFHSFHHRHCYFRITVWRPGTQSPVFFWVYCLAPLNLTFHGLIFSLLTHIQSTHITTPKSWPLSAPSPQWEPSLSGTPTHSLPLVILCHSFTMPFLLRTSVVCDRFHLSPKPMNHLCPTIFHCHCSQAPLKPSVKHQLSVATSWGPSSTPTPACYLYLLLLPVLVPFFFSLRINVTKLPFYNK